MEDLKLIKRIAHAKFLCSGFGDDIYELTYCNLSAEDVLADWKDLAYEIFALNKRVLHLIDLLLSQV